MTSEPVGNGPRSTPPTGMPGNTHKDRDSAGAPPPTEEREKLESAVSGKVVTRKPAWYKRMARSMIAEDVQNVNDFVLTDIIVPAIKNLIRDVIVGGTDRTLYGAARNGRAGVSGLARLDPRGSLRTQYDKVPADPIRRLSTQGRARHDFAEIVLESRSECIDVIQALIDQIHRYKSATVADLYDVLGETAAYTDRGWGWTDLTTADVRQVRGGFLLDLPQPEPLR